MAAHKKLIRLVRRIFHFLKNQSFDIIYLGVPLGISVKTKYSDKGSHDAGFSDYVVIRHIFNRIKITPDDVLVDVGCAKGRVIGWWLKNGYTNKIIGVELDEDLAAIAGKFFRYHSNVKIIRGDIMQNMPEDATIFYLFNPFKREIIKKFKQKIINTYYNKKFTIVYCNCEFIDEFYSDGIWNIDMVHFPSVLTSHKAALISPDSSRIKLLMKSPKEAIRVYAE